MAEPIEMLFGILSQVSPRNHVLDVGYRTGPPTGRGTFKGLSGPLLSIGF